MPIERIEPGPGQESVWDYPRPPRLEECRKEIRVVVDDEIVAHTTGAKRVLETSHPPVYYIPPEDVRAEFLVLSRKRTWCEWKGEARYFDMLVAGHQIENAAWSYPEPIEPFEPIRDHLAFYPQLVDACFVDGEQVQPQPGGFYGGWITHDIVGPFKGERGTMGW